MDLIDTAHKARLRVGSIARRWASVEAHRGPRAGIRAAVASFMLWTACAPAADVIPLRIAEITAATRDLRPVAGHPTFVVRSSAREDQVRSELFGLLPVNREQIDEALGSPSRWCELLLLTPDVGGCSVGSDRLPADVEILVLSRFDAPRDLGTRYALRLERAIARADYGRLELRAASGPYGTHDLSLSIEIVGASAGRCLAALTFTYSHGWEAEIAQLAYDVAQSPDRTGFSLDTAASQAEAAPVTGLRATSERQVARLFLAIQANGMPSPRDPSRRFAQSLDTWLAATQALPDQLAEPDPKTYRRIKLRQFGAVE